MEPVITPLMPQIAFRLCNFIGVVRECIINATGVDIQIFTQMLHRYTGAFDMPTRITNTPGRVPFQRLIFKLRLGKP